MDNAEAFANLQTNRGTGIISTALTGSSTVGGRISTGPRRYVTDLDLAVLRDMGYSTIPEPTAAGLLVLGIAVTARRRRR